jgi:hypothetical protein
MDMAGMAARAIKRACSRPQHGERGTIATTMAKRLADVVGKIRCTLERNAPYDLQTAALLSRNRTQQDKDARSKAGREACLGWVGYDRQSDVSCTKGRASPCGCGLSILVACTTVNCGEKAVFTEAIRVR